MMFRLYPFSLLGAIVSLALLQVVWSQSCSSSCTGSYADLPPYVTSAFAEFPNDFPNLAAAEPYDAEAVTGRWYVPECSALTEKIFYPCDCILIDMAPLNSSYYQWTVGKWPDRSANNVISSPKEAYAEFYEGQPNVFKEVIPLISPDLDPNPYYTLYVTKTGPKIKGTYRYVVIALQHQPWDSDFNGLPLANGTVSFEIYAQDVDEYYELYHDEVVEYIKEVSGPNPAVYNALKLETINHTDCMYPFRAPYSFYAGGGKKEQKKSKKNNKSKKDP